MMVPEETRGAMRGRPRAESRFDIDEVGSLGVVVLVGTVGAASEAWVSEFEVDEDDMVTVYDMWSSRKMKNDLSRPSFKSCLDMEEAILSS